MKLTVLFVLITTLTLTKSLSQGFGIEVFSGIGIGVLKADNLGTDGRTSNRVGGHLGVLGSVQISNSLFLESGLVYSPKGGFILTPSWGLYNPFGNYPNASRVILNYLDIPFLLSANSESLRVYIGPQLSLLTRAKFDADNSRSNIKDVKSSFYSTDVGLRLGIGYNSRPGVSARLDYGLGFKDIYRDPNSVWRTNSIEISVGYKYLDDLAKQSMRNGSKKGDNKKFPPIHREFQ